MNSTEPAEGETITATESGEEPRETYEAVRKAKRTSPPNRAERRAFMQRLRKATATLRHLSRQGEQRTCPRCSLPYQGRRLQVMPNHDPRRAHQVLLQCQCPVAQPTRSTNEL